MAGLKIVIDPGHYSGYNAGAIAGYFEGDTVWTLAGLLRTALEEYGGITELTLTRQDVQKDMALEARGKLAADLGADLFVSLHTNGFTSPAARGAEGYYSLHRSESKALCDAIGQAVTGVMREDMPGSCWRGSRTLSYGGEHPEADYYGVLRGAVGNDGRRATKHALLIEHGFHSNPEECAWLTKAENLRRLARAEAGAVAEFFGLAPKQAAKEGAPEKDGTLYRVQAGAFSKRENAEKLAAQLKSKGYQSIVKEE